MNLTLIRLLQKLGDPIIIFIISGTLALFLILVFLLGRATALNHLKKHHMREIYDDEVTRLNEENMRLKLDKKDLLHKNKYYMEIFSGMRHFIKKGE